MSTIKKLYKATKKYSTEPVVIRNPERRIVTTRESRSTSDMRVSSRPQPDKVRTNPHRLTAKGRATSCP